MGNYKTKKIKTGKYHTFFCIAGEHHDETMILLHGSGPGANAESNWSKVIDELSENYQVIAIDLLGFGQTEFPESANMTFWEWTTARVQQILELMDYLKIDKANLIGNSMGGLISLNAVLYDEDRFGKLILMGSGGGMNKNGPSPEIVRMTQFFKDPTIQAFRNLIRWFVYDDSNLGGELDEIVQRRYENIMRPEIRANYSLLFSSSPIEMVVPPSALRRIKQPVLLIHGYEDAFIPKETSLWLAEHIPNAEVTFVKGCGHWVQIEKRERFIELTKCFLKEKTIVVQ